MPRGTGARSRGQKAISLPYELQGHVNLCAEAFRDAPGRPNYSAFVEWATRSVGSWLALNPGHFDRIAVREMLVRQAEELDAAQVKDIEERQRMRAIERQQLAREREQHQKDLVTKRGEFQLPEDVARVHWTKNDDELLKLAAKLEHDGALVLAEAKRRREIAAMGSQKVLTFEELVESGQDAFRVLPKGKAESKLRAMAKAYGQDADRFVEACRAAFLGTPQTSLRALPQGRASE